LKLSNLLAIGSDPADEADLRIRKRAAVATTLTFMSVAAVVGVVDVGAGLPVQAVLALVQLLAFGAALLVFRRTRRLAPLIVTISAVGLAVLFLSLFPAGGLSWGATNLIWTILVPLGAVLFLGARAAVPALVAVVAIVVAAVAIDPMIQGPPPEPTTARLVVIAINVLVPAAIALGLVVFIDGERVRAKAESEALLLNVLPHSIAERLKHGERVIADHFDEVTVLFSDLVDFTPFAARESPGRVVEVLNEVFTGFDSLAERFGLEKIKTIGDAYMVVAGAPEPRPDHASAIIGMAHAMLGLVESVGHQFRLRVGVASGPAVAGVIGHRKFSYDIWGDAVNMASRMESTADPGMIQVSASTRQLCGDRYKFTPRQVEVKGVGEVRAYVLDTGPVQPGAGSAERF
jgi:guanylate cyclase